MRVRSLLILGTMVLGVMLLGGVALAVTKTCTTKPWALSLCKISFSSRKMMAFFRPLNCGSCWRPPPANRNNERDSRSSSAGSGRSALPDLTSRYASRYASVTP